MALDAAYTAVRDRAEALWPTLEPDVPLAFENANFKPPLDTNSNPLPWLLIEVVWSGGEFELIGAPGNNLVRREGHIWAFGFIPQGRGNVARAHQLIARAAAMFEGQNFVGVVCDAAMPGGPASSEDGKYDGQSIAIPFEFDETA